MDHDWKIIPQSSLPKKRVCKNLLAMTHKILVNDPGWMPGRALLPRWKSRDRREAPDEVFEKGI